MIQVKEMMQDNDLKNSKSKDKGSKSRSQSMDEQSHYKKDKTITRQSINVKRLICNAIGGTEELKAQVIPSPAHLESPSAKLARHEYKYPFTTLGEGCSMGKGLLGPSGRSGGLIEVRLGERCGGNGRRGGSMSGVGEGKVDSIGGMGGGLLAIRLMVSNYGRGGRGLVVEVGAGGGKVNGGGVDLGVSKRLEVTREMICESGGIKVGEVGGGVET
ncbi:hypothetical protein Tco_1404098 [Tanacetum coccineum]